MMKITFLGTPSFVNPIRDQLAKDFTLVDSLREADLAVVAAYGRIITPDELKTPKYGFINVHPSLLPKYRGPSPIQEAILNGDKISGITIIKMDEEVDHGPIIYQEEMELSDKDIFDTLSKKMFLNASEVLPQVIEDYIQETVEPKEQNHGEATFSKLLSRESGYFDIDNPPSAEKLDRMIRAYYPWPGVWTRWSPSRHPDHPSPKAKDEKDLKIVKFYPEGKIQMEGKKVMPLKDFLNGYPGFPLRG